MGSVASTPRPRHGSSAGHVIAPTNRRDPVWLPPIAASPRPHRRVAATQFGYHPSPRRRDPIAASPRPSLGTTHRRVAATQFGYHPRAATARRSPVAVSPAPETTAARPRRRRAPDARARAAPTWPCARGGTAPRGPRARIARRLAVSPRARGPRRPAPRCLRRDRSGMSATSSRLPRGSSRSRAFSATARSSAFAAPLASPSSFASRSDQGATHRSQRQAKP